MSTFVYTCNIITITITKISVAPKSFLMPFTNPHTHSTLPCSQAITELLSVPLEQFPLSRFLCKWNHYTIFFFFEWLTWCNGFEITHLVHGPIVHFLLFQSNISLYGYTTICFFMNLLITFPRHLKNVSIVKNNTHTEKYLKPLTKSY